MNVLNFIVLAADDVVGKIENPIVGYKGATEAQGGGLILFFSNILRLVFVFAGIYAFVNFVLAGFQYMSAGGDSKQLSSAWSRIWQSLLGLILIVGSFALAALFGQLVFGRADFILNPQIYGPGGPGQQ
ncbi:hypothetical protein A2Z00_01230 [Candidatus Gottesmanbacteria bacterium RBG_13_45_10]|uniref:Uncharacterized protein n=1 Tax=Candidatus Gottesmanbacteria bacterium RBG_13_45_10 TaxID=1798370 RepID=A0A1F5ZFN9_9BACT|nr:MAG: hypothetical protein A2Z00_01230 [Candidatus Gottesmanbacteria bacterium RBG_13_45_10]